MDEPPGSGPGPGPAPAFLAGAGNEIVTFGPPPPPSRMASLVRGYVPVSDMKWQCPVLGCYRGPSNPMSRERTVIEHITKTKHSKAYTANTLIFNNDGTITDPARLAIARTERYEYHRELLAAQAAESLATTTLQQPAGQSTAAAAPSIFPAAATHNAAASPSANNPANTPLDAASAGAAAAPQPQFMADRFTDVPVPLSSPPADDIEQDAAVLPLGPYYGVYGYQPAVSAEERMARRYYNLYHPEQRPGGGA